MAITKLVLDRQAAGRVFTFGSSAASADVNLAKASGDSEETVLLTSEGSIDIKGDLKVTGSLSVNDGINANNQVISNVAAPSAGSDAVNKTYVDGEVSSLSGSLASEVVGIKSNIVSIESNIDAIELDAFNVSGSVVTLKQEMSQAQSDIDAAELNIFNLQNDLDQAESDIDSLESRMSTAESDIDSLESRMSTAESNVSTLQSEMLVEQSNVDTLQSEMVVAQADINQLQSDMLTAEADIDQAQIDIDALEAVQGDYAKLAGGNTFTGAQVFSDNVTINGDLIVAGTQTVVNSTQVDIGDNIISLNGSGASLGGIEVNDATAPNTNSGSLLWDASADKWIAGAKGAELTVLAADYGTEGQILTMVSGEAVFADPQIITVFKRAAISGDLDGSNKSFNITTSANLISGSEQVILNGIILMPGAGNDYTFAAGVLQFNAGFPAPHADDNLQVFATF